MPKDDERKEMTQEELDAREEKFRTFFLPVSESPTRASSSCMP